MIKWLGSKIKSDAGRELFMQSTTVVLNSVKTVFQTYVEALKKSGGFDRVAQIEAFRRAKELALSQLPEAAKVFIESTYGDIDEWLRIQIESTIDTLKNK